MPIQFLANQTYKNLIVCHFWVSYLLFAHPELKCFLQYQKKSCKIHTFRPESPRLGPPEASFGSIMNGFKIPMKNPSLNLSSFKTNVSISLSHRNQAVFPCTKILVVVLGKLLFICLTNKKSTFEFNC